MSDTTAGATPEHPTTAGALIAFHNELSASGIPPEAVQAMVVDASRILIQNDGCVELVVKRDA